jgi:branched-chain amino acid transport system substrate-binding protein
MDRRQGRDLLADGAATSAGLAIQQVASDKKRIFVMSTPTATAFIGKQCSPYGFQFAADTYALAKGVGGGLAKAGGDSWFFITADYEFGASLQASTEEFVKAAGGKVLGSTRAPLGTADFSSYLLQAKASGAKVVGLANAAPTWANCIKQAAEFASQERVRLATPLMIITTWCRWVRDLWAGVTNLVLLPVAGSARLTERAWQRCSSPNDTMPVPVVDALVAA